MDVFTGKSNGRGFWSVDWWEEVLRQRSRKVWAFASDDCHDVQDGRRFNRGWILVNSEIDPRDNFESRAVGEAELRQDLLANIRNGNFYPVIRCAEGGRASRRSLGSKDKGPTLRISVSDRRVFVQADRTCDVIEFRAGSSSGTASSANSGVKESAYEVGDWEEYVRVRVLQRRNDGQHHMAFSQPLSIVRD